MGVIKKRGITYAGGGGGGGSASLPDYSFTEHKTGRKWIDGSDIWERTLHFPQLPYNQEVTQSIPNIKYGIDYEGFAYSKTDLGFQRPLPFPGNSTNDIRVDLQNYAVRILTFSDWSGYAAYLTVRYTKSS